MTEPRLRILIADDHEIVRHGVRNLLDSVPDFEVCAEAAIGRDAVNLGEKLLPDVAIMDLSMPDLNGLEAARQLKKVSPKTRILIFTMHDAEQLVHEVFNAGVSGYVLKSDAGEHLVTAIRTVAAGKHYFSSKLSEIIFGGFLHRDTPHRAPETASDAKPTSREREIIQLLAEGKSNKEVAATLGISPKTAETHRAALMKKLNFHSISDLVRYAIRNHMIEP